MKRFLAFFSVISLLMVQGCNPPEQGPSNSTNPPSGQDDKDEIVIGKVDKIPAEGGVFSVSIQYTDDFSVEVESDAQAWLSFVKLRASGTLDFKFEGNRSVEERVGKVTVKDKAGKASPVIISFTQTGRDFKEVLMEIYYALEGPSWNKGNFWDPTKPISHWGGAVMYNENEKKLYFRFDANSINGQLPECIGDLGGMVKSVAIIHEKYCRGTLPDSFRKLVNLEEFILYDTGLTSLPDVFGDMKKLKTFHVTDNYSLTGPLPNLNSPVLESLEVRNNSFTGSIPDSWGQYVRIMDIRQNCLSGRIDHLFKDEEDFMAFWNNANLWQNDGYVFDVTGVNLPPAYQVAGDAVIEDVDGKTFTFDEIIKRNKYTAFVIWESWCPFSNSMMPRLVDYYYTYHKDGLEIIATSQTQGVTASGAGVPLTDYEWYKNEVHRRGYDQWYNFFWSDYKQSFFRKTPNAEVYDHEGNVVFSSVYDFFDPVQDRYGKTASSDLIPFLETLFGPEETPDAYESIDYSQDGQVMTLQTATVGNGINIVFMGDAYTDRDMKPGGLYEEMMNAAMEEFFAIEPYKSFRNRFNAYAVKVVSKNGRIGEYYTTALSTYLGNNRFVGGNNDKCYEYALKVPAITDKNNLLVCVLVNTQKSCGTTSMSESLQSSVAYLSSFGSDPVVFGGVLRHEAGGHGFGFLADEYYRTTGQAPADHIAHYNDVYEKYGWYSNVDFTNDPSKIRWAAFLNDDRYEGEVGIFEGGALYSQGAWRPSVNSMMNDNLEYFNAPSRWAIYQRIMKLSGEECSFEKFLEYDEINRKASPSQMSVKPPFKAPDWQPGAPPVVVQ